MPKFGSHIIFAEEAMKRRPDLFGDVHGNALRFGAVGPDTTLFMFDEYFSNPMASTGLKITFEVLRAISDIQERIEHITNAIDGPIADVANWWSGGVSEDLRYSLNVSVDTLFSAAKLGIANQVGKIDFKNPILKYMGDLGEVVTNPEAIKQVWTIETADHYGFPFRNFGHPYTDDGHWKQPYPTGDYSKWWWMDMLHYRKTGQFAETLRHNAQTKIQVSYANGYTTHYAGDIAGHPFINSLVGGPFRNHAYRHMVLETLSDTWLWDRMGRNDILGARLDKRIDLSPSESDQVAQLVIRSMRDVYFEPNMVPNLLPNGYPTEDQFLAGYRLMQQYLKLSTSKTVAMPKAPPDTPKELIQEIKTLLQNNVPGSPPHWNGNIEDFLKALFSWAGKGLAFLAMLATLPVALVQRIIMLAPRWLIYLFNLALFYLSSALRTMLCLGGWGYCSRHDFSSFGFLESWIRTPGYDGGMYPAKTTRGLLPYYWLAKPKWLSNVENEPTMPLLPNRAGLMPYWMVDPGNVADPAMMAALAGAATSYDARTIAMNDPYSNGFGNVIDFSIALLDGQLPYHDFDLDGDRGYGFKPWEELPPNERYL